MNLIKNINMKKDNRKTRIWLFTTITILLITILWFFMSFILPSNNKDNHFSSYWHMSINNHVIYHGRISDYHFNNIHNHDKITFTTRTRINMNNTSLMIHIPFSSVKLYQNNKLTYTYQLKKHFVPTAVIEAPLYKGEDLQDIKIEVEPSINEPFTNIPDFKLIKEGTLNETIIRDSPHTLLFSSFLIILGIILIILAFSLIKVLYPILAIGLYSLLGGIWILCCSKTIQVFSSNYFFNTYAEFYSLYLCGIAFSLLQYSFIKENKHRKYVYPVLIFMSSFSLSIIILSYFNIFSIQSPLVIFQLCEAITNIIFIIALFANHNWKSSQRIVATAFIVHFFYGLMDASRYNIERYLIVNEAHIGTTYTQYGLLVMIILMVYAFVIQNEEVLRTQIEEKMWQEVAYTDALTKIRNRTYFNEKIRDITDHSQYTIIYFDLNGLKLINDTFSHISGDLYIIDFANFLKDHFKDASIISRMGGDEFIIVYNHCNINKIKKLFKNFKQLQYDASRDKDYPINASYGIAYSFEGNNDFNQVISLADHRMYAMKNSYYKTSSVKRRI